MASGKEKKRKGEGREAIGYMYYWGIFEEAVIRMDASLPKQMPFFLLSHTYTPLGHAIQAQTLKQLVLRYALLSLLVLQTSLPELLPHKPPRLLLDQPLISGPSQCIHVPLSFYMFLVILVIILAHSAIALLAPGLGVHLHP
jgi:hypothetical protein